MTNYVDLSSVGFVFVFSRFCYTDNSDNNNLSLFLGTNAQTAHNITSRHNDIMIVTQFETSLQDNRHTC